MFRWASLLSCLTARWIATSSAPLGFQKRISTTLPCARSASTACSRLAALACDLAPEGVVGLALVADLLLGAAVVVPAAELEEELEGELALELCEGVLALEVEVGEDAWAGFSSTVVSLCFEVSTAPGAL